MHNRIQCKVVVEARDTTFFFTLKTRYSIITGFAIFTQISFLKDREDKNK